MGSIAVLAGLALGGAVLCFWLIRGLRPWLMRYALARPSARGLHTIPTPQGGGIAVLTACAATAVIGAWLMGAAAAEAMRLGVVLATTALLALLGLVDDVRPLPALPRLTLQLMAMAVGVLMLPDATRVLPFLPFGIERGLLVIGGAWFINLTNFMDGMDLMTVSEMVPVSLVLLAACWLGDLPLLPGLLALGLLAGLVGFAPANRPVARLFLGDVGSLPIGFLVAYALFSLAGAPNRNGSSPLPGAVLPVLYYVADSGLTLLWRVRQKQRVWEPHRSHFYQVAVARGLSVPQVLIRVIGLNAVLGILAVLSLKAEPLLQAACLAIGCLLVGLLLAILARGSDRRSPALQAR